MDSILKVYSGPMPLARPQWSLQVGMTNPGEMMIRALVIVACFLNFLGLVSCGSSPYAASASSDDSVAQSLNSEAYSEGDQIVTLDQCPAEVQRAIRARIQGGTLIEIERTTDHGEVLYEVDYRTASGVAEFDVAADGDYRGSGSDGFAIEDGDEGDGEEEDDEDS